MYVYIKCNTFGPRRDVKWRRRCVKKRVEARRGVGRWSVDGQPDRKDWSVGVVTAVTVAAADVTWRRSAADPATNLPPGCQWRGRRWRLRGDRGRRACACVPRRQGRPEPTGTEPGRRRQWTGGGDGGGYSAAGATDEPDGARARRSPGV